MKNNKGIYTENPFSQSKSKEEIAEGNPDYEYIKKQLDEVFDPDFYKLSQRRAALVTGYWQALVDIMIRKGAY